MLLGKETHFDATSQGLFRRAIAQSGAGHHAISSTSAQRIGQYLAEKLDVEPEVEAIAAVPSDQLIAAQLALSADVFEHPDPARWGEVAADAFRAGDRRGCPSCAPNRSHRCWSGRRDRRFGWNHY